MDFDGVLRANERFVNLFFFFLLLFAFFLSFIFLSFFQIFLFHFFSTQKIVMHVMSPIGIMDQHFNVEAKRLFLHANSSFLPR